MARFSFGSLRVRLLLLVLLALVPAFGMILYTAAEERRLAAVRVKDNALQVARLASGDHEQLIGEAHQLLISLAQLPGVRRGDSAACSRFFADLLKQYPRYANLGAVKPNGELFCSGLPRSGPVNLADRTYFRRAVETRDFAIGEYQIGRVTGKATVNFGYPVLNARGEVQAVVFAALDLGWLNRFAADAHLPAGSTLTVIDQQGTVLIRYPDSEKWAGQRAPEAPLLRSMLTEREGVVEAPRKDGISRIFGFTRLSGAPQTGYVYVSIGIPSEVAFAEVNRMLVRNLAGLGIVTVLVLVAAWVGSDLFILRQARALMSATERLGAGDLSARTELPSGQGELSHLARTFDEMAEALQRRQAEARQTEEALRRYAERLNALHGIDQAILGARSLEEIAQAALGHIQRLVPSQRASIIVFDYQAQEAIVVGAHGVGETGAGSRSHAPLEEFRIAELQQGGVHLVEDVLALPRPPAVIQTLQAEGLRSYVNVPLIAQGELIGCLHVGADSPDAFSSEALEIVREVADQLAIAVRQVGLYEEVQRYAAELEQRVAERTAELAAANQDLENQITERRRAEATLQALYRASLHVQEPHGLQERLDHLLQTAQTVLQLDRFNVLLADSEGRWLEAVASLGTKDALKAIRIPIGPEGGMLARAYLTQQMFAWDGREPVPEDLRLKPPYDQVEAFRSRVFANVPLVVQGRVIGVLGADRKHSRRPFEPITLELLQLFAAQAALAIDQARLDMDLEAANAQLQEAMRQVEEASRHKSEFLANMSHELRTPLNSIIGFSEILHEQTVGPLNEKQARYVSHIWNSGQHLLRLINDILDLAKVEAGKFVLQPEALPVPQTLEDILVIARGLANKKGQRVDADIEANLPPLRADPVRFKQILFNLLSNAVKFTPEGGQITVTVRRVPGIAECGMRIAELPATDTVPQSAIRNPQSEIGECLEIRVGDTGPGIKPEDMPRLFQEFVQLEATATKRHEGTGLGLALTKRLVELHGGKVWAESEGEGRGSTFTVDLPFSGPEQ